MEGGGVWKEKVVTSQTQILQETTHKKKSWRNCSSENVLSSGQNFTSILNRHFVYCFHHKWQSKRLIHTHEKLVLSTPSSPLPKHTHATFSPLPLTHLKPQVEASMHGALVWLPQVLCRVLHAQMFCNLSCRFHQVLCKITGCHLCVCVCVCV